MLPAIGPRSSGDRAPPSGGGSAGSNPAGGTQLIKNFRRSRTFLHVADVSAKAESLVDERRFEPYGGYRCPSSAMSRITGDLELDRPMTGLVAAIDVPRDQQRAWAVVTDVRPGEPSLSAAQMVSGSR